MKIFIDIGHPAHVHYFRNSIKILKEEGHLFCITARDKDVTIQLMNEYKIDYFNRGKGGKSLLAKLWYGIKTNWFLYKLAISYNPDIFLSFASPYAAQIAKIIGKPHIAFTDTEHATLGNLAFIPFSHTIITPNAFQTNLGIKHIRFNGFMENAYLSKNYFKPSSDVLQKLNLSLNDKYVVIRLVSWTASHDIGHQGFSHKSVLKLIQLINKYAKIRITTEGKMHHDLQPYAMPSLNPSDIHHVLAHATLFIGEGATMASECAVLGTPCIYVNTLSAGTLEEQEKQNLLVRLLDIDEILLATENFLQNNLSKNEQSIRCADYMNHKIDVTKFINWIITHFPASINKMKKYPNYQDRFKA